MTLLSFECWSMEICPRLAEQVRRQVHSRAFPGSDGSNFSSSMASLALPSVHSSHLSDIGNLLLGLDYFLLLFVASFTADNAAKQKTRFTVSYSSFHVPMLLHASSFMSSLSLLCAS